MGQTSSASAAPDTPLTLITLGGARLLSATGAECLGPGKPLALVTYLACSPRRAAAREHLVDLLWADLEPDKARHALRQTIWYLRQILGASGLATHSAELTLAVPLRLDRDDFLAAVGVGDLSAAAELYHGDFLAGFAAPGSVEFEHWADIERQRLRVAFLRVAQRLVRSWLDGGRFREATQLARRLRDTARASEAGWRLLLESLLASGDQLGFTLESGALTALLQSEGRDPEPATRVLLARDVRPGATQESPTRNLVPALVGRESEFGQVSAAWERVTRDHGQHLHLTAAAGLGKTRLLVDVYHRLRGRGARVISLRANPGDRAIPYGFAGELARALADLPGAAGIAPSTAGTLVALHPSLSSRFSAPPDNATDAEALRRRSSALGELLTVVSEEQPCAVLLDDLHWADPASRQALRPLLDRLHATRVLLVTSARPGTSLDARGEGSGQITLEPLRTSQLLELIASLGQLPDEPWSRSLPTQLQEATGGSPLLVLETLQLAIDRGLLHLAGGLWSCEAPDALAAQLRSGSALRARIEQLEREPRWLLLLLALAGTPLDLHRLTQAARRGTGAVDAALLLLEQRGLAERSGDVWRPAHDEIAACAETLATPEERDAAHHGLAEMYANPAETRRTDLIRAAEHLRRAGSRDNLRAVFLQFVAMTRREGDGRRLHQLAGEFLEDHSPAAMRDLLGSLGWLNRIRYSGAWRPARFAAGLVILLGAAFAFRRSPAPDITLYGRGFADATSSRIRGWEMPLLHERWEENDPLGTQPRRTFRSRGVWVDAASTNLIKRPGREEWAGTVVLPKSDSGTNDIFLFRQAGDSIRLTWAPRDDSPSSWSPDGRWLAITTARWSTPGADDYDIAIMNPETRALYPLVRDPELEAGAFWSPDGTRLGFLRRWKTEARPEEACWVTVDPAAPIQGCVTPAWGLLRTVVGWNDASHFLAIIDSAGLSLLVRMDVQRGTLTTIRRGVTGASSSTDGAWVEAYGTLNGEPRPVHYLLNMKKPERAVPLPADLPMAGPGWLYWGEPREREGMLDTLRFFEAPDSVALGVATALRVVGVNPVGRSIAFAVPPTWETSDTTIAVIDARGFLRPRRGGRVTVRASVGGWRRDSVTITVAGRSPETVLQESWDSAWQQRWITLGEPRPVIVPGPDGTPAFWNHGDGRYFSGAVSEQTWSPMNGLGVEVLASTPVRRPQWQIWEVSLADYGSREDILKAREVDEFPPPGHQDPLRTCVAEYPAGEGMSAIDRMSLVAGDGVATYGVVGPWIREPRWYRVRLQILPDGRCAVAVNGVAVWLASAPMRLDRPLRLLLGYSSEGTRLLHGSLEVWQGVRTDIDWAELDTLDGRPLPLARRPGSR